MTDDKRRTDACLKACEGISTQNLEDNVPFLELARRYNDVLRERDALRAKIADTERQEPVAWIRGRDDHRRRKLSFEEPAKSSPDKFHWSPLYALPGAQPAPIEMSITTRALSEMFLSLDGYDKAQPGYEWRKGWNDAIRQAMDYTQPAPSVPEGWQLVPTAESRHPGIYKMLGALHAADNTPGMSEWESYRAMLSEAPEAKP